MQKVPVSLRLPVDLVEQLDKVADKKRRTRTLILIEIIEKHFDYHPTTNGSAPKKKR